MATGTGTHEPFVAGESWCSVTGASIVSNSYNLEWAREFRYDGARQRYLNRKLDVTDIDYDRVIDAIDEVWTDYDGDSAYGDFSVTPGSPPVVTNLRSFEPGLARVSPFTGSGLTNTAYHGPDHLGTTRTMLDPSDSSPVSTSVFTAFGEPVSGPLDGGADRYGYVGAHGYQAHDDFPFLHVGHRYYDPSSGRFLQRDPIGVAGGMSVYVYTHSIPTVFVDPDGERALLRPPHRRTSPAGRPRFSDIPETPIRYQECFGCNYCGWNRAGGSFSGCPQIQCPRVNPRRLNWSHPLSISAAPEPRPKPAPKPRPRVLPLPIFIPFPPMLSLARNQRRNLVRHNHRHPDRLI